MSRKIFAILALFAVLALAACGSPAASKPPVQPTLASKPVAVNPAAQPATPSNPPAASSNPAPAQLAEPTAALGSEGAPNAEGGRPEGGPSVASVTDPGGLPPSPPTNDAVINNIGDERMVVQRDSQNRYQVLFVSGWTVNAGDVAGSVRSTNKDRFIQIQVVTSGGKSASDYAIADEAQLKASVSGYQTMVVKPGKIPYGAVTSLIYRYQAGQNAVTGKGLNFIAARVYVPRPNSTDLAIITTTAPAANYGDLSEIFDRIVNSFKWM